MNRSRGLEPAGTWNTDVAEVVGDSGLTSQLNLCNELQALCTKHIPAV